MCPLEPIDQDSMSSCRQCGGQRAVIRMMRMDPMVQQIQLTCGQCGGAGHSFRSSNKTEVLEVHIPKDDISYQTRPKIDAGDASLLMGSIN